MLREIKKYLIFLIIVGLTLSYIPYTNTIKAQVTEAEPINKDDDPFNGQRQLHEILKGFSRGMVKFIKCQY
jgi:hypothetical protein